MTTQLIVWNLALLHVGERNLSTTTDAVPARYALDDAYAGAIDHCLGQGLWNFAMRQSQEGSDGTNTIGYGYYFTKPTDWVRTYDIYQDSYMQTPLLSWDDKFGKWHANHDPIYVKYVSNHATLGGGLLTAWPQAFTDYVAFYLARMICNRIGAGGLFEKLVELERRHLMSALSKDGMDEPVRFPPTGDWANSRSASYARQNKQPN